jgi:hypothetical protein
VCREGGTQRRRDAETQRRRDAETQRRRDAETGEARRALATLHSIFLPGIAAIAAGCTPPATLTTRLSDQELSARLAEEFPAGSSVEAVHARLDEDRVPRRLRRGYAGPPVQMLARLFPPGGFWVDSQRGWQETPYVDVWFLFGDSGLERIDTERRVVRIGFGEYLDPPFHTPELLPREARAVPGGAGSGAGERD